MLTVAASNRRRVLPTLANELDAVAIWVKHIGRIVARIVDPCCGRAVIGSSRRDCSLVGSVDLFPARGYKTDMHCTAI